MLGFWMWGTDCKWVTPETTRERKRTKMGKESVLLPGSGMELESCLGPRKEGQKVAADITTTTTNTIY